MLYVLLSFPADEVGNGILDEEKFENSDFDLGSIITEDQYKEYFGDFLYPFTGINMIDFYRELIKEQGCEPVFILSNKATDILEYTNNVINCDIHTRYKTNKLLKDNGANVTGLYEILNSPVNGSGYNEKYGLLVSNKSTEERLKLFPRDGQRIVDSVQKRAFVRMD